MKRFSARVDSTLAALGVDLSPATLQAVAERALGEARTGGASVEVLMAASAELKDKAASPAPIDVRVERFRSPGPGSEGVEGSGRSPRAVS